MFAGVERFGKGMGEWTLIVGVLLMPLVIFTNGYRVAATPKFFVLLCVVLGLGIAFLCAWKSIQWRRAPFALPWGLFLLLTGLQAVRGNNTDLAVEMCILQVCGGIVGLGAALLVDHFGRILRAVAVVGIGVSILGILEYLGWTWVIFPSAGRPSATLGFRNIAGMYLAVSLFFSVSLFFLKDKRDHGLGFVAVMLMGIFLIFTRTRGAWLGVCVASLLGMGMACRVVGLRGIFKEVSRYKVAGFIVCVVWVGATLIPPHFQDKSLSRLDEKKTSVVQSIQFVMQEGGDRGRLTVWRHTFEMIADAPLFGVGLNNWSALYPRYDQGDIVGIVVSPQRPHNDFLWIWAELGLVGLVLFLWLLWCVCKQVLERIQAQNWVVLCAGLGAVALLVHSIFSFPREQPIAVFFLSLALGIAGQRVGGDEAKEDWRNLGLGVCGMAVAIVGLFWGWAAFQFDVYFSRALLAQAESHPEKQVQAAQQARSFGLFDHRILLIEGVGRYALDDFEGAVSVYQTYLTYQPYLPALHNNLGRAYDGLGQDDAAEKAYLRGLETFSGDGAGILISNLAAVYKRQGKIEQALALYENGVQLPAEGHHNLGLIYAERGLWDQSLASYRQALKLAPDMTIVYFSMAGVKMLQGDLQGAAKDYEMFLKHWDGIPDYVRDAHHRLRQIYPVLGDQYLRAQRFADAGQAFERLVDLGEGSPEVLNNLVLIYGRLKQADKALQMGQVVLQQHPNFAQIHLSLASVYESRGDGGLALKHYRLFIKNSVSDNPLLQQVRARIDALNRAKP